MTASNEFTDDDNEGGGAWPLANHPLHGHLHQRSSVTDRENMRSNEALGHLELPSGNIHGVAQGWRTSDWDEAKKVGRILLVWKTAAGLSEHVELGKWSGSAWTNTYGKPFFGDPDGWAPLKPFAAQPPAAPVETDRQKLLEALPLQFQGIRIFVLILICPHCIKLGLSC